MVSTVNRSQFSSERYEEADRHVTEFMDYELILFILNYAYK
jgi:hypothetical protein